MRVVGQSLVPVCIINVIGEVKQLGWIVVKKVTVVLAAHVVRHWMRVDNVDLAKRGSDSTDVTVGICIVCVIIMCLLGSGFASEEHCQHHADSNKHKLSHYFSFVIQ